MLQKDFTNIQIRMFIVIHEVDPIIIGELYDFRIDLNKDTSDRELERFANKIIKEYNERVRERKYETNYIRKRQGTIQMENQE